MEFYRDTDGTWIPVPTPIPLRTVVRSALLNAMAYTDGNQAAAAKLLGISVRTFNHSLERHNVPVANTGLTKQPPRIRTAVAIAKAKHTRSANLAKRAST